MRHRCFCHVLPTDACALPSSCKNSKFHHTERHSQERSQSAAHELFALLASENQEPHNRVPIQIRDSLCAPNRVSFEQQLESEQSLLSGVAPLIQRSLPKVWGCSFSMSLRRCWYPTNAASRQGGVLSRHKNITSIIRIPLH